MHVQGGVDLMPSKSDGRFRMNFKVARLFFDSPTVQAAVDQGTRRVLSRFGAFVRSAARRSMRRPGKKGLPSPPGTPPRTRKGQLKNFVFFFYDWTRRSVVIGPELLPGVIHINPTIPQVHEEGGRIVQTRRRRRGRRKSKTLRRYLATYPARPYMGPAFEKVKDEKLDNLWRNSVRAA
jgi:hypothetical protein